MMKLQAVLHVSTAYCNTQYEHISEEIYSTNGDPLGVIDLCKRMDPSLLNSTEMTSQIIGNKPNTYTFTKALGESALVLEGGTLPIAVVRPSIVVAAWKEPIPGWVENLNGPTGIVAAAGKGVLRTVFCKRGKVADWVPVDVPINLSIVAAWKISTAPQNAIPVYNCTSGATNPITWGQLETLGLDAVRKYPMENMLWYPGGSYKESAVYNKICQILLHSLPAHLIDVGSLLLGRKQMMVKVVTKMHKAQAAIEYFAINEWKWSNDNVKKLNHELSDADKEIFNFDLANLKWADFIDDYVKGTREFIFKEEALQWLRGTIEVHDEMDEMKQEQESMKLVPKVTLKEMLVNSSLRKPLIIAMMMMLAQQLSGINCAIFYSTNIFKEAGLNPTQSQSATLGMGAMNVAMTFVSLALIEKAGRKVLMLSGLSLMICMTILLLASLLTFTTVPAMSYVAVVAVITFVVGFATGPGSIPWFFVTELFAQSGRPTATSIAVVVNWTANFLVGLGFQPMQLLMGPWVFMVFIVIQLFFIVYVAVVVPETKGKTIDEITARFRK